MKISKVWTLPLDRPTVCVDYGTVQEGTNEERTLQLCVILLQLCIRVTFVDKSAIGKLLLQFGRYLQGTVRKICRC